MSSVKVGIVACEIFKHELEMLTEGDPDIVFKEYLEFGLHIYPEDLRTTVIQKLDSLKGKVDAVFLCYGACSSLGDITSRTKVPTISLPVDDCIAALLTPEGYAEEKRKCAGTWFASPGWAELGKEGVVKYLHLDCLQDEGYDPDVFFKMMFVNYSRGMYVDTGVPGSEGFEQLSEKFAQEMQVKHECRKGTLK